ncbi:MAG TPA: beta-ketoacyl-[acyl-carrier-protein] synthase II [Chloroflexi bacterium]|nr:beta-ketoacyl-[acyl-carrier-protein] synthase II [Chloroflexota bacterium]HBY07589.1 beta-ketoacyl-[acyl-carrier-protein] synthase II [Chloroflexota bacterium]
MEERIVITGLGAISPIGLSAKESWQSAIHGVSGVAPITHFDAADFLVQVVCEVKNFDPENYIPGREARRMDRYEQMALAAAKEALAHSGLEVTPENAARVGVIVSSAIGGITSYEEGAYTVRDKGPRRINPFLIPMLMPNGAAGLIGITHGFQGPSFSVASACASGIDTIGMAWMMLKTGLIDVAVTGASEATITATAVAAFDRMGAMTRRTDNVPQPFDAERDGLVMGEGAAVLVMERESHARARGAEIFAEFAGYAATADAYHITAPSETGEGGSRAIKQALASAGLNLEDVNYINAHGTSTPLNDASETRAIKATFGDLAYNIPVSSTKSMTGHMMGATGALEAIFCVQAVRENIIPPTINYHTPDPVCDLDYVPNEARETPVNVAISNAFGFGGHNAVMVVKKYL